MSNIKDKKKKAVIFDMDGVISDTQKLHGVIESGILRRFGIQMSPDEISNKYAGISDYDMFNEIFQKNTIGNELIGDIIKEKWQLMNKVSCKEILPIPYVIQLIKDLKKHGFLLAVASGSPRLFIEKVLKSLKIADFFDTFVSFEDVEHGKPAPDMFLLISRQLCVDPCNIIVVEDGLSGMIAAKSCGMKCVGLVKDINSNFPATKIIASLDQLSAKDFWSLLSH